MKVFVVTLGFVPARIWRRSLDAYRSLHKTGLDYEHYFVDAHYPLNEVENRRELWSICADAGISVLDPGRNLGLHGNFNFALSRIPYKDDDVIIGYDPDSNPISPGFDGALVHAIQFDQRVAWSSLLSQRAEPELIQRGYDRRMIGHVEAWVTRQPVVNSICAWRGSFLRRTGGLHEPNQWYGFLEGEMFWRMKEMGMDWAFLPGWRETDDIRNLQDREYLWWKWKFAHLREWPGDFRSYVEAGCPPPSDHVVRLP